MVRNGLGQPTTPFDSDCFTLDYFVFLLNPTKLFVYATLVRYIVPMFDGGQQQERQVFSDYFGSTVIDVSAISDTAMRSQLLAQMAAAQMAHADFLQVLCEAKVRGCAKHPIHRDTATWLADETRLHRNSAGGDVNLAKLIHLDHPRLGRCYRTGRINADHLRLFTRIWNQPALRPYLERDLDILLGWTANTWVETSTLFEAWETLVDPVDPNDHAERAHRNRGFNFVRNGHQLIGQLDTTTAHFATIEDALRAKVNELFEADWDEAQARCGADACLDDLQRTDTKRWHDALMLLLHAGIAADPATANVTANIVVDHDTMKEEAERRDAEAAGQPVAPRSAANAAARAETYRCETASGMPLAPADALDFAIAGHVRMFVMNTKTNDFTASAKARLFTGSKRLGIMIRDRHCQGAGCSTRAVHCEADHTIRYTDGGLTVPINAKGRCGPCHRHKTRLESLGLWPGD